MIHFEFRNGLLQKISAKVSRTKEELMEIDGISE
jgi:hypothetical protein